MNRTTLSGDDLGKRVLNADGTEVGRIVHVEPGRAYVDPNPGLLDTLRAKLGWGTVTDTAHPLDDGSVAEITDDAIRLRGRL
ncbi:PRC-barrel domain containing protein [Natronobiforma cellulositropha]|uniref:PRC-barrel domain containing protein n=1 Tax=Natronobiforma cellulositropha TaxID=1679076 RepID=UPI0021D573AF|nr:PRC-barrel domain containing protein [Natronobiforma cellulositropha]